MPMLFEPTAMSGLQVEPPQVGRALLNPDTVSRNVQRMVCETVVRPTVISETPRILAWEADREAERAKLEAWRAGR